MTRMVCPCGGALKLESRNCSGCMGVELRVVCKACGKAAPGVACCSTTFCKPQELEGKRKPSTKKRAYRAWKEMRKQQEAYGSK